MDKILTVDGKEMGFRATALTPRLYRHKLSRDIVQDMNRLRKAYNRAVAGVPKLEIPEGTAPEEAERLTEEHEQAVRDAQIPAMDLELFENMAWVMARQYDNTTVPDSPEEWLDGIEGTFSIYEVLPDLLDLWQCNEATTSKPKNA